MILTSSLTSIGQYCLFIRKIFTLPDRWSVFFKRTMLEISKLGIDSIPLVIIISIFIGAVCAIQMQLNTTSPLMPAYTVGLATRDIVLLEFSNSILCLILAGKVGSNIASEIGTMRVTEQIDALEIMGVNSANYLILPKIVALVSIMPVLVTFSVAAGIIGAYCTVYIGHIGTVRELTVGMQYSFNQWFFWMGVIKAMFFAFLIATISSYYGYNVKGGSIEVGKASTNAVVTGSVLILVSDTFLTQLLS